MRFFVGVSYMTLYLRIGNFISQIRKRFRIFIAVLCFKNVPINGFAVQSGRGTCFLTTNLKPERL